MDYYDKENSRNSLSRRESTVKPFSRSTHGGYIANRQQWLESGSAGRPNPGKYTNRRASISSKGVIAQRMKWVEEQSQKGPMVAAPKGQDIGGQGIIARQRKWVEEQGQKGPMIATPKGQDIAGAGIIDRQRKWVEEQSQTHSTPSQVSKNKRKPWVQDLEFRQTQTRNKSSWAPTESTQMPHKPQIEEQDLEFKQTQTRRRSSRAPLVPTQTTQKPKVEIKDLETQSRRRSSRGPMAPARMIPKGDQQTQRRRRSSRAPMVPVQAPHNPQVEVQGLEFTQTQTRRRSSRVPMEPVQMTQKPQVEVQGLEFTQTQSRRRLSRTPTVLVQMTQKPQVDVKDLELKQTQSRRRSSRAPMAPVQMTNKPEAQLPLLKKQKSLGKPGCYLTYETDSGGRLMLCYQRGGEPPRNTVGFWAAGEGKSIQGFKFNAAGGRSELIKGIAGGDSNRRKYFDGWCMFVKLAKAMNGSVKKFYAPGCGVGVDVYGYNTRQASVSFLDMDDGFVDVSNFNAVAVVPRGKNFLQGVKTMMLTTFLEKGGIAGSSTTLN